MNSWLVASNIMLFLTWFAHTFMGDREYRETENLARTDRERQHWTMGRGAFHMVTVDLLFAALAVTAINFTDWVQQAKFVLQILAVYFMAYGLAFFGVIAVSRKIPQWLLRLPQGLLLVVNAVLLYVASINFAPPLS